MRSSSTIPSQSLSTLSQTSTVGVPAVAVQTVCVPSALQTIVPLRAHAPRPAEHASPTAVPGDAVPLRVSALRTITTGRPEVFVAITENDDGYCVTCAWCVLPQPDSDELEEPNITGCVGAVTTTSSASSRVDAQVPKVPRKS